MIRVACSRLRQHPAVALLLTLLAAALGVVAERSLPYVLACGLYVLSATAIDAVRRADLGTLACLGWPGRALAGVVLAEAVLIAAPAGVLAAVVTAVSPDSSANAAPVTVLLVLVAGVVAAVRAVRVQPSAVLGGEHG
jgi:putative ABC transport system permease protein